MIVVCQAAVSCGENQLISIPPMLVVFQTVVSCGGSQLIGWETRVASLREFSPKNANLFLKSGLNEKYEMFGAKTKHSSLFLKLFSERRSSFLEKL
jgi:hypothetical protein